MVGANMKAETMSLMDKRAAMEAEMNSIIERLCQPGAPGLSGNLIDSEGFPRTDIDIPVVRAERLRLSALRNDHKEITDKIDANIQILHSARLTPRPSTVKETGTDNQTTFSPMDVSSPTTNIGESSKVNEVDMMVNMPFAMVDEIADASPAAEDGLQLGDQIVKFGNVEAGDDLLQRLARESQDNQDRPIPVVLLRQGGIVDIPVTPRTWQGRGLLGCHFRIL